MNQRGDFQILFLALSEVVTNLGTLQRRTSLHSLSFLFFYFLNDYSSTHENIHKCTS